MNRSDRDRFPQAARSHGIQDNLLGHDQGADGRLRAITAPLDPWFDLFCHGLDSFVRFLPPGGVSNGSGGQSNTASGGASSVSGRVGNTASVNFSWTAGGAFHNP